MYVDATWLHFLGGVHLTLGGILGGKGAKIDEKCKIKEGMCHIFIITFPKGQDSNIILFKL